MTPSESKGIQPVPQHVRPNTLHVLVLLLWIAVGVFTGVGIAATIGSIESVDGLDLSLTEHIARIGSDAGPFFVAAVVALGAVAIVEVVLITLGHVQHIEVDLEPDAS